MFWSDQKAQKAAREEGLKKLYFDLANIISPDSRWVKVKEKRYLSWFGLPQLGTKTVDSLTGNIVKTSQEKPYLIYGPIGSIKAVQEFDLKSNYCQFQAIADMKPITDRYLDSLAVNGKIDWQCIQNRHYGQSKWVFYPDPRIYGISAIKNADLTIQNKYNNSDKIILNGENVKSGHALGDFVIADSLRTSEDLPDLQTIRVLNGHEFINMFDMRSFKSLQGKVGKYLVESKSPKGSLIKDLDVRLQRSSSKFDELKNRIEAYASGLNEYYYRTQLETQSNQIKFIVQVINGYTLGFIIAFKGDEFNQAEIQYFEMSRDQILKKVQKTGTINVDSFMNFIDRKVKNSGYSSE